MMLTEWSKRTAGSDGTGWIVDLLQQYFEITFQKRQAAPTSERSSWQGLAAVVVGNLIYILDPRGAKAAAVH